jgi:5-(carboxyamino)imidazole ribonucleotide synthase
MDFKPKTIGILGGGQLGRMSALAAARLGIPTHIYTPEENSPASHVAAKTITGAWDDKKKLKDFAAAVDAISYEFENIPVETIRYLKDFKPVYPDEAFLAIAQDRIREKQFLNDAGIATARWAAIASPAEAAKAAEKLGYDSFILKTTRFGYDGKGQVSCRPGDDIAAQWKTLNSNDVILEERIDFACEISVIAARDKLGQIALYGPILNEHRNHILSRSLYPAPGLPEGVAEKAREITHHLAEAVDLIGVLALEMFVTKDGKILANEIAPRTHNSGHWTIDACAVSQFEQHVRTISGLPVGDPSAHSSAEMLNLIGRDVLEIENYIESKNACIHLYGKHEIREGRKMGHVTLLKPLP